MKMEGILDHPKRPESLNSLMGPRLYVTHCPSGPCPKTLRQLNPKPLNPNPMIDTLGKYLPTSPSYNVPKMTVVRLRK